MTWRCARPFGGLPVGREQVIGLVEHEPMRATRLDAQAMQIGQQRGEIGRTLLDVDREQRVFVGLPRQRSVALSTAPSSASVPS